MLYTTEDLKRFLAATEAPPAPVFDVTPIVAELRRLGGLIVDSAPPRIQPG